MITAVDVQHRRFSTHDYHRMAEAGILHEDDRVELIEGAIIEMAPIGPLHASLVDRIGTALSSLASGKAIVRVQNPLHISDLSEPEPDILLVRPRDDFYRDRHPGPSDTLLVIEVADSSEGYDRSIKLPLYAQAGVPEVWLVVAGLPEIEIYREPASTGFRSSRKAGITDEIGIDQASIRVNVRDLLG